MRGTQRTQLQKQKVVSVYTKVCNLFLSMAIMVISSSCAPEDTRMSVYEYLAMQEGRPTTQPATTQPAVQPVASPSAELLPWSPGPYRIGPGDIVEMNISGLEEIGMPGSYTLRVSENGQVRLPTVGEINVAGLTLDELEGKVRKAYVPKYLQATQVTTKIAESAMGERLYHTINVTVMGAVSTPASVQLRRDNSSVLQAVMAAGGPNEFASGEVTWIPASNPSGAKQFKLYEKPDLIRAAQIGRLQQSDVVIVERRKNDFVYVQGLVNAPGPVPLGPDDNLTAMQAIASGGGSLLAFSPKEATLYRTKKGGEILRVKLDLARMRAGEDPDIMLEPGDILNLPHTVETRVEEFLAKAFIFRFGLDTTFNPWTHYYFKKDREVRQGQDNGFFGTFGRSLITQDLTPLWTSSSPVSP